MRKYLFVFMICLLTGEANAVEGYKSLTFGMSIDQALALNLCDFKEEKIPPIKNAYRYNDFACENLPYEGKSVPLTIQFIDKALHRIVIILSKEIHSRKAILEELNIKYGDHSYEYRGNIEFRLYEDKTVQAAIFDKPYPSVHIIYQSLDYLRLIKENPEKKKKEWASLDSINSSDNFLI